MKIGIVCLVFSIQAYGESLRHVRSSVIKVFVTSQRADYGLPWQKMAPSRSYGSGFYIGDGRIITNAHVVADSTQVELYRDGADRRVPGKVIYVGHDVDLALLSVSDDSSFFQGMVPLKLGPMAELRSKVATIGFPKGGDQISVTEGVVSRIGYRRYVHSFARQHLLVQIDAAINSGNSGGPVIQNSRVVGVAFQSYSDAENTGYIIPSVIVKRFLKDVEDGSYEGSVDDGIDLHPGAMDNEAYRSWAGGGLGPGVLVNRVSRFSYAAGKISKGDIITSVMGAEVGRDGKVVYHGERVSMHVLLDLLQVGQEARLEIIREGKLRDVTLKVAVPERHFNRDMRFDVQPNYRIFGGLVFTPLTQNYLMRWGRKWYLEAPNQLLSVASYFDFLPEFGDRSEVVLISHRQPNIANRFVEEAFINQPISEINDQPIRNFADLNRVLDESKGPFTKFSFFYVKPDLYLPNELVRASHQDTMKQLGGVSERHSAVSN